MHCAMHVYRGKTMVQRWSSVRVSHVRGIAAFTLSAALIVASLFVTSCASGSGNASAGASSAQESQASSSASAAVEGQIELGAFSWSGGSGRLKGMDCTLLVERDGQAYATIEFASSSYSSVRVEGVEYENMTPDGEVSTFEIPVNLNANTQISALTTAMSSPHWVDYTIYCATVDAASASLFAGDALDENPPQILGFTAQGTESIEHAQLFRIFSYDQGVFLVEVSVSSDGAHAQAGDDAAESALYAGAVCRYLVLPEGVEVPAGLEKELIIVRQPAKAALVLSASALSNIAALDRAQSVIAVGEDMPQVVADAGITDIATSGSAAELDFRSVVSLQCDLIVEDASIIGMETDGESLVLAFGSRAATLGVPLVIDRSSNEASAEASAEWVKVYGALLGCYDEALRIFKARTA